jgi:hypothetical protein
VASKVFSACESEQRHLYSSKINSTSTLIVIVCVLHANFILCLAAAEAFPCESGVDAVIEVQFESSLQTLVSQRPRLPSDFFCHQFNRRVGSHAGNNSAPLPGLGGPKFHGFRVVPVHSRLHPCGDVESDRCTELALMTGPVRLAESLLMKE